MADFDNRLSEVSAGPSSDSDFTNFAEADEPRCERINIEKSKESSTSWPSQKAVAADIIERIKFSQMRNFGRTLSFYTSIDYQVR